MRKSRLLVLALFFVLVTQAIPVGACGKTAWLVSTEDGDMIVETEENIVWKIMIVVYNWWDQYWTDVKVTDNLNAELEIDSIVPPSVGNAYYYTKGKSEKVTLVWDIGTLAPGQKARLYFYVSTDVNPGGHQEYTTPGEYQLNSGAEAKWKVDGVRYNDSSLPIPVTVVEQN